MKTKFYFLGFASFLFLEFGYAQTLRCGTPDISTSQEVETQLLLNKIKNSSFYQKNVNGVTRYVPLKMHLFANDDGTQSPTDVNVNDALSYLNEAFKPFDIEFYFSGTSFNRYNSTLFNQANQTSTDTFTFHNSNRALNAINVYVTYVVKSGGNNVGGYSYIAPQSNSYNFMYIVTGQLNDNKTTPHEMGHYFNLAHTFNNSNSSVIADRELVTRNFSEISPRLSANCTSKGDYICDTPSDPYNLTGYSISNCLYTGTPVDANNDYYNPDMSNFMDYNWCLPAHFTTGQYNRMSDGYLIISTPNSSPAYAYTLDAPETVQTAPSSVAVTTGDYAGNGVLKFNDNSTSETGYIIERSNSASGPFVAVQGIEAKNAANPISLTLNDNAVGGSTVYYRMKPSNSKNNYSNVSGPVTIPVLCGNTYGQSCDMNADPNSYAWNINQVILKNSNNTVLIDNNNTHCSAGGIGNYYPTISAKVIPGQTYNLTVRSQKDAAGLAYTVKVTAYIDWNKNGTAEANETTVLSNGTWFEGSGNISIPTGTPDGAYRLRVALTASSSTAPSFCGVYYGEIEDYKLLIGNLATSEVNKKAISMYPNPTKSILNFSEELHNIKIYSIDGKIVKETKEAQSIDVVSLSKGVYFISATEKNGNAFSQKFIKE